MMTHNTENMTNVATKKTKSTSHVRNTNHHLKLYLFFFFFCVPVGNQIIKKHKQILHISDRSKMKQDEKKKSINHPKHAMKQHDK